MPPSSRRPAGHPSYSSVSGSNSSQANRNCGEMSPVVSVGSFRVTRRRRRRSTAATASRRPPAVGRRRRTRWVCRRPRGRGRPAFPRASSYYREPADIVVDDARLPGGRRRVRSGNGPVADAEHLHLVVESVVAAAVVAGPDVVAVLVACVRVAAGVAGAALADDGLGLRRRPPRRRRPRTDRLLPRPDRRRPAAGTVGGPPARVIGPPRPAARPAPRR